jgi:hypothetical protein
MHQTDIANCEFISLSSQSTHRRVGHPQIRSRLEWSVRRHGKRRQQVEKSAEWNRSALRGEPKRRSICGSGTKLRIRNHASPIHGHPSEISKDAGQIREVGWGARSRIYLWRRRRRGSRWRIAAGGASCRRRLSRGRRAGPWLRRPPRGARRGTTRASSPQASASRGVAPEIWVRVGSVATGTEEAS